MIDLKEPARPSYTPEEEQQIKEKFVLLLHTFLLVYLTLHNFLIPLVNNLFHGEHFWLDMHFWFLGQLPLHFFLRKKMKVPHLLFAFLLIGSLTRLIAEVSMASSFKSWTLFSVIISEFSTFLFLFVLKPQIECEKKWTPALLVGLLAVVVPLGLNKIETRSERSIIASDLKKTAALPKDSANLGCSGSQLEMKFPLQSRPKNVSTVRILECGFEQSLTGTDGHLRILNQGGQTLNLRLFMLKPSHRRVSWKFQRLVQVRPGESWELASHLKKDGLYLVKTPERRALGHLVIVPESLKELSLGAGRLEIDYDSITWSEEEER